VAGGILSKRRITPSERISKEIIEIIQNLTGHDNNQKLLGQLMQLSMLKLVQESRFTGEAQEYSYECIRILGGHIMSIKRAEGVIGMALSHI
jgi:hypothetical protein